MSKKQFITGYIKVFITSVKNSREFRNLGEKALSLYHFYKLIMDEVEQEIVTPYGRFNVDIYIYMVDPDKLTHYYLTSG